MNDLRNQGSPEATDEMWSLANGPGSIVYMYSGCIFNGVRFHTRDRENRRKCQNSGLVVQGEHLGKTIDFYGYLCKVWELTYMHGGRVVLFQCEWYNTGTRNKVYTDQHITSIDVTGRWYKDDPFVLPSQAKQVFYVSDTCKGNNWRIVERVKHRGVWDVPEVDDVPNEAFQQHESSDVVPICVEDNDLNYCRDDIPPEIVNGEEPMAEHSDGEDETMAEYIDEDDDEENLHSQSDTDIDPDVDYDV